MRSRSLFLLGIFCTLLAPGVASASTGVTVDTKMHFRLLPHTKNVEMRWFRYKKPKEFRAYLIIRSSAVSSTDPMAGDVVASTTNRYSTNYEDHPTSNGAWYYRLCIVTKTLGTICSKTTSADVTGIKAPTVTETPGPEIPSGPAVLQPPTGDLALTVSMASSSAALTWTPLASASTTFSYYAVVRSQTNADLSYPHDGYLAHLSDPLSTGFTDTDVLSGQVYYRVCAVDEAEHLWCGNAAAVTR